MSFDNGFDDDFICNDNAVGVNNDESSSTNIEIYVKQRNGRKCITTVLGLGNDKDKLKAISKELGKMMSCSGSVKKDNQGDLYLKFSGKNIQKIRDYLLTLNYKEEDIHIHGLSL